MPGNYLEKARLHKKGRLRTHCWSAGALAVIRLFDDFDFLLRQPIQVVDEAVDLAVEGGALVFVVCLVLVGLRLAMSPCGFLASTKKRTSR